MSPPWTVKVAATLSSPPAHTGTANQSSSPSAAVSAAYVSAPVASVASSGVSFSSRASGGQLTAQAGSSSQSTRSSQSVRLSWSSSTSLSHSSPVGQPLASCSQRPVVVSHESTVQATPSSQSRSAPRHSPAAQRSFSVQASASSHTTPSGAACATHSPVASSHCSIVQGSPSSWQTTGTFVHWPVVASQPSVVQGFPSSQLGPTPVHTPPWQTSFAVQASASSQAVPSDSVRRTQPPSAASHSENWHGSSGCSQKIATLSQAPVVGLHRSLVHGLSSSQSGGTCSH